MLQKAPEKHENRRVATKLPVVATFVRAFRGALRVVLTQLLKQLLKTISISNRFLKLRKR